PAPSLYFLFFHCARHHRDLHSFPTRRSSDLGTSTTRWLAFTAFLILVRKSAIGSVIIILIFRIWFSAIPIIIRAKPLPSYNSTLDRKSTRLNSSHVKISYAVFCLKKKR